MLHGLFGRKSDAAVTNSEPSRESRLIEAFLGCECEYIPANTDPDEVLRRFDVTEMFCRNNGMCPVLVAVDDILAEAFFENAGIPLPEGDSIPPGDMERITKYRNELIASYSPANAEAVILAGEQRAAELLKDRQFKKILWESKVIEFDDNNKCMEAFRDIQTRKTRELLLAKIPVSEPWQVAAWFPMGGWNGCPSPEDMLAMAKRWYQKYGAVICCVTYDEMEFHVANLPSTREEALALAKEHFYFCEDRLTQYGGYYNLATLVDGLLRSRYWYFWWD